MPIRMALGMVFAGFRISSAGIVLISKPAYAQKISTRAGPKLPRPNGRKGEKLLALVAVFRTM